MRKERSIWKNLGWALVATPVVSFVGILIITLVGALDDAITTVQSAGYWWLILVGAYILSLIYFISEPKIRRNHERNRVVNTLILYWKDQIEKQTMPQPSEDEIKLVRGMLIDRIKVWAWFDAELWAKYFPEEKYSKHLFGVMDNFTSHWEQEKSKYKK